MMGYITNILNLYPGTISGFERYMLILFEVAIHRRYSDLTRSPARQLCQTRCPTFMDDVSIFAAWRLFSWISFLCMLRTCQKLHFAGRLPMFPWQIPAWSWRKTRWSSTTPKKPLDTALEVWCRQGLGIVNHQASQNATHRSTRSKVSIFHTANYWNI